jgi:hypothetical protein
MLLSLFNVSTRRGTLQDKNLKLASEANKAALKIMTPGIKIFDSKIAHNELGTTYLARAESIDKTQTSGLTIDTYKATLMVSKPDGKPIDLVQNQVILDEYMPDPVTLEGQNNRGSAIDTYRANLINRESDDDASAPEKDHKKP